MKAGTAKAARLFIPKKKSPSKAELSRPQTPFERLSEENYYLRISEFTEKIIEQFSPDKMKNRAGIPEKGIFEVS